MLADRDRGQRADLRRREPVPIADRDLARVHGRVHGREPEQAHAHRDAIGSKGHLNPVPANKRICAPGEHVLIAGRDAAARHRRDAESSARRVAPVLVGVALIHPGDRRAHRREAVASLLERRNPARPDEDRHGLDQTLAHRDHGPAVCRAITSQDGVERLVALRDALGDIRRDRPIGGDRIRVPRPRGTQRRALHNPLGVPHDVFGTVLRQVFFCGVAPDVVDRVELGRRRPHDVEDLRPRAGPVVRLHERVPGVELALDVLGLGLGESRRQPRDEARDRVHGEIEQRCRRHHGPARELREHVDAEFNPFLHVPEDLADPLPDPGRDHLLRELVIPQVEPGLLGHDVEHVGHA